MKLVGCITTRWNGDLATEEREVEVGEQLRAWEGANPGRSARSHLLAYPMYLRSQIPITTCS